MGNSRRAEPATHLHVSPGLKAIFTMFARMAGRVGAQDLAETTEALVACDFRYNDAALILGIPPETLRQRVHRYKERAMEVLNDKGYSIPRVKSVEENLVFGADDMAYERAAAPEIEDEGDET